MRDRQLLEQARELMEWSAAEYRAPCHESQIAVVLFGYGGCGMAGSRAGYNPSLCQMRLDVSHFFLATSNPLSQAIFRQVNAAHVPSLDSRGKARSQSPKEGIGIL